MPTLLLRLCGPMQSWGTRSRFVERDTELEPSKSGVFGMLCAAAGIPRTQPIPGEWLALTMGVRCDRPGHLASDYQTAGGDGSGIARADGKLWPYAEESDRRYLADADFLVGLRGQDRHVLQEIEASLKAPRWQICLGRKAFLPALPVYLPGAGGVRDADLPEALLDEEHPLKPELPGRRFSGEDERLRFVFECSPGESNEVRQDQPRPDSFATRRFDQRWVQTEFHRTGGTSDG